MNVEDSIDCVGSPHGSYFLYKGVKYKFSTQVEAQLIFKRLWLLASEENELALT